MTEQKAQDMDALLEILAGVDVTTLSPAVLAKLGGGVTSLAQQITVQADVVRKDAQDTAFKAAGKAVMDIFTESLGWCPPIQGKMSEDKTTYVISLLVTKVPSKGKAAAGAKRINHESPFEGKVTMNKLIETIGGIESYSHNGVEYEDQKQAAIAMGLTFWQKPGDKGDGLGTTLIREAKDKLILKLVSGEEILLSDAIARFEKAKEKAQSLTTIVPQVAAEPSAA